MQRLWWHSHMLLHTLLMYELASCAKVTLQSNQWATLACDAKAWFEGDHIAFYTFCSQCCTPIYNDQTGYFPLSLPSGQQAIIYNWFVRPDNVSEEAKYMGKLMTYIWRLVHPPSYLQVMKSLGADNDDMGWIFTHMPTCARAMI